MRFGIVRAPASLIFAILLVQPLAAEIALPKTEAALEIRAEDSAARREWALAVLEPSLGEREWKNLTNGPRPAFFRDMQAKVLEEPVVEKTELPALLKEISKLDPKSDLGEAAESYLALLAKEK